MAFNEQTIKLAAKMYGMRDSAKILLGDEYEEKIAEPMEVLKQAAERQGISCLQAAQRIATGFVKEHDCISAMIAIAAAVEICERES